MGEAATELLAEAFIPGNRTVRCVPRSFEGNCEYRRTAIQRDYDALISWLDRACGRKRGWRRGTVQREPVFRKGTPVQKITLATFDRAKDKPPGWTMRWRKRSGNQDWV
jgi:hypothetical protein